MKNNRNSVLTGVTGEYYVVAELSRMGYIASITLRNTKGIDILCSNADATKTVSIQVKTGTKVQNTWILNEKGENYHSLKFFYVFVNLDSNLPPEYSIVPSKIVANYITKHHREYLGLKKGKNIKILL